MRGGESRFARIAPLYLRHTARMKCSWCARQGKGEVFIVTADEIRARGGVGIKGYPLATQNLIVRRAVRHYATMHPEVRLP